MFKVETRWRARQLQGGIGLLAPLSYLFGILIRIRRLFYARKSACKIATPVISIGNITAGGCGKTPFTHMLAAVLMQKKRVAVLSRGYRAQKKIKAPCIVTGPEMGDEAYLLASKLPALQVWVGKDRALAAKKAQDAGAEIILLDDGMQQRRLAKDVDIVLIDAKEPLEYLLPRGSLRDFPKSLATADLLVITHADTEDLFQKAKERVARYSKAPVIAASMVPCLSTDLTGKRIGVFCGIAKPHHFFSLISSLGAHIVHTAVAPDHMLPDLALCAKKSIENGAAYLVCTEKDRIKIPSHLQLPLPLVTVRVEMQVTRGKEILDTLIRRYTDG